MFKYIFNATLKFFSSIIMPSGFVPVKILMSYSIYFSENSESGYLAYLDLINFSP